MKQEDRRTRAQSRANERAQRSASEQLKELEARGHGHCKEATRLREEVRADKHITERL